MSWFSRLFSDSVGNLVEKVGNIADEFHLSGEEKQKFKLDMKALIQQRDSEVEQTMRSEMQAKERILVAELTQGDSFTKRARPTVVYAGLLFIFLNYILLPLIYNLAEVKIDLPDLPNGFWAGWSGIVATWSVGRSFEKRGAADRFTRAITGSAPRSRILGDDEPQG